MSEPTRDQNENEHHRSPAPAHRRPLWIAVVAGLMLLLASVWRICA
jgi:hypothetical protein